MSGLAENLSFRPEEFTGKIRLFPLPNVVLFPHVLLPLHVFENRYRDLMEEALAADKLVAMAVLAPGWESDYEGRPPLHSIACLARIATFHRLEDGRFNILLLGLKRVELVRELAPEKSFREAEARLRDDEYRPQAGAAQRDFRRELLDRFRKLLPAPAAENEELRKLLADTVPLGMLTDIITYTLNFEIAFKERVLRELCVDRRAAMVLERMADSTAESLRPEAGLGRKFPPEFSSN